MATLRFSRAMAISNDWLADTWTLPLTVVTLHTRHGLLPELTRAFDILIAIPVGFEAPQVALLLPTPPSDLLGSRESGRETEMMPVTGTRASSSVIWTAGYLHPGMCVPA